MDPGGGRDTRLSSCLTQEMGLFPSFWKSPAGQGAARGLVGRANGLVLCAVAKWALTAYKEDTDCARLLELTSQTPVAGLSSRCPNPLPQKDMSLFPQPPPQRDTSQWTPSQGHQRSPTLIHRTLGK